MPVITRKNIAGSRIRFPTTRKKPTHKPDHGSPGSGAIISVVNSSKIAFIGYRDRKPPATPRKDNSPYKDDMPCSQVLEIGHYTGPGFPVFPWNKKVELRFLSSTLVLTSGHHLSRLPSKVRGVKFLFHHRRGRRVAGPIASK